MPSRIGCAPALAIRIFCGAICGTVLPAPTCALAQSDTGLFFEAPDVLSPAQPSITVHLWAQFPAADYAFARTQLDVLASEPGWSDPMLLLHGPGATAGVITGPHVLGVFDQQLNFPPEIVPDPSNPIEIWRATFEIVDFTPRTIVLTTETVEFAVFSARSSPILEPRPSHEAFHEIRVIPAPGALGPGGLVGLGALGARRRRSRRPR
ncbi:MAG: hypothetical protein ACF8R7_04785 [Phycisphaerales bacterium JB039]